ncbi:hypothetical protein ACFYMW_12175 [Streptomyces sp. NPDC006692]|uniref:hypothetical protein n=1 Tax=Streptomyces sp. NPDC006692 TaxID=3364758 RepID=UPI003686356C
MSDVWLPFMDAGIAAIGGALAGSVATVGAAFATGWWQRENIRLTGRAEHWRQRREPRSQVYREFASAVADIRDRVRTQPHMPDSGLAWVSPEFFSDTLTDQLREMLVPVRRSWLDVALAGPQSVSGSAAEIEKACRKLVVFAMGARSTSSDESSQAYVGSSRAFIETANSLSPLLDSFIEIAQAALDDDGTRTQIE